MLGEGEYPALRLVQQRIRIYACVVSLLGHRRSEGYYLPQKRFLKHYLRMMLDVRRRRHPLHKTRYVTCAAHALEPLLPLQPVRNTHLVYRHTLATQVEHRAENLPVAFLVKRVLFPQYLEGAVARLLLQHHGAKN